MNKVAGIAADSKFLAIMEVGGRLGSSQGAPSSRWPWPGSCREPEFDGNPPPGHTAAVQVPPLDPSVAVMWALPQGQVLSVDAVSILPDLLPWAAGDHRAWGLHDGRSWSQPGLRRALACLCV